MNENGSLEKAKLSVCENTTEYMVNTDEHRKVSLLHLFQR